MVQTSFSTFEEFFEKATGNRPYPYQKKLAESEHYSVINVPTGAGKTEAAVLGWLWGRMRNKDSIPRRLIYCLPMRVLVEQTERRVQEWLKNLGIESDVGVESLMGGSEARIQSIHPDKECIIIGTQDMLISGALNRAYGNNPNVWPIVFGLLNNDAMWVMDEIQIMDNALPTSIQLNHFRDRMKTYGKHKTVWMSATVDPCWLDTVDCSKDKMTIYNLEGLGSNAQLKKRNMAPKTLRKADIELKKEYDDQDIQVLRSLHKDGTVTAIMVNTVKRAQDLYKKIIKYANCKLIHSRFREQDRKELNEWISDISKNNEDVIIVSTQVLEAGVDISVRTLITELAPWANMVQRFGRCNRVGEFSEADVYWIDLHEKAAAPYDPQSLELARKTLRGLEGKSVSPISLPKISEPKFFDAMLRYIDVINIFDTMPDLSGNHTDVSRFVRNMEQQLDISVLWRKKAGRGNNKHRRAEICNVPISNLREFLKKQKKYGYVWDYMAKDWKKVSGVDLFPGQTVVLDSEWGGYSKTYGWDGESTDCVDVLDGELEEHESHENDPKSRSRNQITLADHTRHVLEKTEAFLKHMPYLDSDIKHAVCTAARYHDIGKVHRTFQDAMRHGIVDKKDGNEVWAKSQKSVKYDRAGFRHEVVSALAFLGQKDTQAMKMRNLISYLIMSHHGKVRLSLRGPYKKHDAGNEESKEYLLGVRIAGEKLDGFASDVVSIEQTEIDMSMANIGNDKAGNPSWTKRVIMLRDKHGPFRLAFLEAVIRRADWLASEEEDRGVQQ